jgi:hypothetical protein
VGNLFIIEAQFLLALDLYDLAFVNNDFNRAKPDVLQNVRNLNCNFGYSRFSVCVFQFKRHDNAPKAIAVESKTSGLSWREV